MNVKKTKSSKKFVLKITMSMTQAKEDRALMSQLLDQHNKLIDNLKKRDDIIQKKFDALDD